MIEKSKPKHFEDLEVHQDFMRLLQQILRGDFNSVGGILQNTERRMQNAKYKMPNESEFSDWGSQTEWIRFHLGSFNWENRPETWFTQFPNAKQQTSEPLGVLHSALYMRSDMWKIKLQKIVGNVLDKLQKLYMTRTVIQTFLAFLKL